MQTALFRLLQKRPRLVVFCRAAVLICFAAPASGQGHDAGLAGAMLPLESAPERFQVLVADEMVTDDGMMVEPAGEKLTLETLESMALAASPSVQRASALVWAARSRALQAGLKPNPEVGIDFQQLGSAGLAEQYGVLVSQEIVRPRKLQLDRSIAQHEANQLSWQLQAERQRVLNDVRMTYIRALRAERQLALTRDLVEIGQKGVEIATELMRAKEVSRADVLQAELEVETANILHQNARNTRLAVWRELSALVGREAMSPQPLEGDIEQTSDGLIFEEALSRIRGQSPEVTAALARIERARCNLQRQLIETKPNLSFQGLVNWRDNGTGGDPNGALTLSFPIPICNQNQGAIGEARYQLAAAQRELRRIELALGQRLAPVFQRYSNAAEQVDRFRNRILPKAAETLQLTRQSYELGEVSYVNLLTVQHTYANNQLAYLDAMETLRLAEIEISGLLLSGSLEDR